MTQTMPRSDRSSERPRVAVVGGGVSGLAVAWRLRRLGYEPVVIDDQPAVGGRSASGEVGAKRITFGGKNIGKRYHLFREFLRDMGDPPLEHFGINSSQVIDGKVETLDPARGPGAIIRFALPLPKRDLLRFARLAMTARRAEENGFLGSAAFAALAERHGHETLESYFGARFCARVVRPMTVRLNGAEPDEVPLGNFGPNLALLLDSFEQVTPGLGTVFDDFERSYAVWRETRVVALNVDHAAVSGLRVTQGSAQRDERFDAVVLAIPASPAADLVDRVDPVLAGRLRTVRYFPAAVVIAQYAHDVFGEDVRAFVFPSKHPLSNGGAYGVSDRRTVRYTVSGRTARALLAISPNDEQLVSTCERQLARLTPADPRDRVAYTVRRWEHAYCAYALDQPAFLADITQRERHTAGLFLTGDYVRGASLEACTRAAVECATRVSRWWSDERGGAARASEATREIRR